MGYILGGAHLEPTKEEIEWWKNALKEVESWENILKEIGRWKIASKGTGYNSAPYPDSLPYFAHPQLGWIIAFTSLKKIEILEKKKIWSTEDDPKRIDLWRQHNDIAKNTANTILHENVLSKEELLKYNHLIWHVMIQGNQHITALPYIGMLQKEEAEKALSAYFDDNLAQQSIQLDANEIIAIQQDARTNCEDTPPHTLKTLAEITSELSDLDLQQSIT